MSVRPKSFSEAFLTYFDVRYASSQAQRDEVGRIRHRVYCEEFGYERKDEFPNGIETDEFDRQSLHCLVTHKSTGTPAGCVRLVLTRGNGQLPFEKFCPDSLDQDFFESQPLQREKVCEISRLAVDAAFRRRSGEHATRFGGTNVTDLSKQEQRTYPLIAVACYLSATAIGGLAGCTAAFAMMEPFLPKLLARSGVNVRKVGQDIDYHGLRAPYFMTLEETLDNMLPELRELYDEIHKFIEKDYRQN